MRKHPIEVLVAGIFAVATLMLAVGVGAQTLPATGSSTAAAAPHTGPMAGHHRDGAARAEHQAEVKAECEAMMAKKQEMKEKRQAMDATLDNLVAAMNAAKGSKEPDAMEQPIAAVINELVAQRKAIQAMMMEMQSGMMAHMMRHMAMHDEKGTMDCPMMKTGDAPEPKAVESKPTKR